MNVSKCKGEKEENKLTAMGLCSVSQSKANRYCTNSKLTPRLPKSTIFDWGKYVSELLAYHAKVESLLANWLFGQSEYCQNLILKNVNSHNVCTRA